MRVLITGGAGYIGTELIYHLDSMDIVNEIIVYDNLIRSNYNLFIGRRKLNGSKIHFVKGEILDSRKLREQLKGVDVVYHLAAKVSTPFADHNPHEFDQINNWGTAELTYLLDDSSVRRLVHLSSVSVYGSSDSEATIDTPPNPRTFYGISKLKGEEHVSRLFDSGVDTYIIRCGNVYGYSKSMRFDSVINKFIFEANFQKRIQIFGDGNQHRSFIHINRLIPFIAGLINDDLSEGTYNLVEDTFSVNDVVDSLKQIYPKLQMIYVNQQMKMRNLMVNPDERLRPYIANTSSHLESDLLEFSQQFTF